MTLDQLDSLAEAVAAKLRGSPVIEPLAISETEAAKLLSVSTRTLFDLRKKGLIPHSWIGERVLYCPSELRRWLVEKRKTTPETAGAAS